MARVTKSTVSRRNGFARHTSGRLESNTRVQSVLRLHRCFALLIIVMVYVFEVRIKSTTVLLRWSSVSYPSRLPPAVSVVSAGTTVVLLTWSVVPINDSNFQQQQQQTHL